MRRIGLTQRVTIHATGERRDALDQCWTRLLLGIDLAPVPLANAAEDVPAYLEALALDGVILTGGNDLAGPPGGRSPAPERDLFEHRLLDSCHQRRVPVLGVCRGMQLINRYSGGGLARVDGHVSRRHEVEPERGALPAWKAPFEVNSFHDYAIREEQVAPGLVPLARCADGTVEALRRVGEPLFGIMWHPEREEPPRGCDLELLLALFGPAA